MIPKLGKSRSVFNVSFCCPLREKERKKERKRERERERDRKNQNEIKAKA